MLRGDLIVSDVISHFGSTRFYYFKKIIYFIFEVVVCRVATSGMLVKLYFGNTFSMSHRFEFYTTFFEMWACRINRSGILHINIIIFN